MARSGHLVQLDGQCSCSFFVCVCCVVLFSVRSTAAYFSRCPSSFLFIISPSFLLCIHPPSFLHVLLLFSSSCSLRPTTNDADHLWSKDETLSLRYQLQLIRNPLLCHLGFVLLVISNDRSGVRCRCKLGLWVHCVSNKKGKGKTLLLSDTKSSSRRIGTLHHLAYLFGVRPSIRARLSVCTSALLL